MSTVYYEERDKIIVNRLSTTNDTLQGIGDDFGITRERVRQIGAKYGVVRPEKPPVYCKNPACDNVIEKRHSSRNHLGKTAYLAYCSEKCGKYAHQLRIKKYEFTCAYCGKHNVITGLNASQRKSYDKRRIHSELKYCDRKCQQAHLGIKFGWGDPNHTNYQKEGKKKLDPEKVITLYYEEGLTQMEISKRLGTKQGSVSQIIIKESKKNPEAMKRYKARRHLSIYYPDLQVKFKQFVESIKKESG
ncbi:hypothetical protein CMI37_34965 [Candidatus Pacearchaeota archaeon]|nr:hypothetical protein [Candidatus Pacearchaeota archaeon]|tara:strand:+ start:1013 stop:1750 length:738 start_codon:yes stop_codon:yes gene_type:complete